METFVPKFSKPDWFCVGRFLEDTSYSEGEPISGEA